MRGLKQMGLNLTDEENQVFFNELDTDGDGVVSCKEFTDAITPLKTPWPTILG